MAERQSCQVRSALTYVLHKGGSTIVADATRFAELRRHFHDLLELEASLRAPVLDALQSSDPALADEIRRLLARLEERDLHPAPSALPQQIGPFRVLQRLGRGGMGEVYLAERIDATFEQRVALKLIGPRGFSAELTHRFLRERQILARLSHPNIAHLIDGGFNDDGAPWLAMEYVDGLTLGRWVAVNRPSLIERISLVRRIAVAVAFAHGHLVVHRDLKPANILVIADGTPKLLDFGIAKLVDDTEVETTRTLLRALTLRYAAPEQVAGDRITTATDVHALGVLLHELVCECSPWPDAEHGRQTWLQAILHLPPARLADTGLQLSVPEHRRLGGDLQRVVDKALAKPAIDRYISAAAFADDLDDWLADRPLRSGIGSHREQARQLLRRHRWPLLLITAVLAALAVGLLLALREADRAERQSAIAEANLGAMLGVLGTAVPRDFRVRVVPASEFLLRAAERLQQDHADNPELIRRALGEIGMGLINLDENAQAEPIILAAIAAGVRNGAPPARQLGLYKLLVFSQDDEGAHARAEQTAQRIAALAADPSADAGLAVDSLASAAGVLSRHGRFDRAEALYQQADRLREAGEGVSPEQSENFWRQRGWTAWRAFQRDDAVDFLGRAASLIESRPHAFSPLRRAELQQLLAEVEASRGNVDRATSHLRAATPEFEREYPAGHPEHAQFELVQARVVLLQGHPALAEELVERAIATLRAQDDAESDGLRRGLWLQAEAEATQGRCAEARLTASHAGELAGKSAILLPRAISLDAASANAVEQLCSTALPGMLQPENRAASKATATGPGNEPTQPD